MGSFKKLKICRITSKAFAKFCVQRGVDYLGVHVIDFAFKPELQELCNFIDNAGSKAILLTKEKNAYKLNQLIGFYKPWAIQLHYPLKSEELRKLISLISCPVIPVFTDSSAKQEVEVVLNICEQFAIYDTSFVGGTGETNRQRLLKSLPKKYLHKIFLAGGVTPNTIDEKSRVAGYDIQSFCRPNKTHNFARAEQIIDKVKGSPFKQLSISLTDSSLQKAEQHNYSKSGCLEYQVDCSNSNLYKHFKTNNDHIDAILKVKDSPFTLHIFEKTRAAYQKIIDDFMASFSDRIIRINIQYSSGLDIDSINTGEAKICASVYHEDFNDYLKKYPNAHKCLSLILPKEYDQKIEFLNKNKKTLSTLKNHEIWFDRKMDSQSVRLTLQYDNRANFIIGDYILKNPLNEQIIHAELNN